MSSPDSQRQPREQGEDRLTVRQALVVWLVAAGTGWLVTVAAVYLATRVF